MVTIFAHFTNYFFHIGQRWKTCPKSPKISVHDFFSPMADFFLICNKLRFHPKSLSPALNDRKCCSKNYEQTQEIAKNCEFSRLSYFLQIIVFQQPSGKWPSNFVPICPKLLMTIFRCCLSLAACRLPRPQFSFLHMFDMFRVNKICSSKSDNDPIRLLKV